MVEVSLIEDLELVEDRNIIRFNDLKENEKDGEDLKEDLELIE